MGTAPCRSPGSDLVSQDVAKGLPICMLFFRWLADSKKKSQWLRILKFSGQKTNLCFNEFLPSDSWFYVNRFPNSQTWTCQYNSLVGLVHLCFELVLAPEILFDDNLMTPREKGNPVFTKMDKVHKKDHRSIVEEDVEGVSFCPVRVLLPPTLISRFELKCLNSLKKTLRHTGDGQLDSIFQLTLRVPWIRTSEIFNNFRAEKGMSKSLHWY